MIVRSLAVGVTALALAGSAWAAGPTVVIDPGHDARANLQTEPIGPGSATRKIKDGGGTHGIVTGIREADLVLDVSLRLRTLLRRAGVTVVMTRTRTAGPGMGNIARAGTARHHRALRLHGLQLGRRTGDPRRARLHDEPRRGQRARAIRGSRQCGARTLSRDPPHSRPRGVPLRGLDRTKALG